MFAFLPQSGKGFADNVVPEFFFTTGPCFCRIACSKNRLEEEHRCPRSGVSFKCSELQLWNWVVWVRLQMAYYCPTGTVVFVNMFVCTIMNIMILLKVNLWALCIGAWIYKKKNPIVYGLHGSGLHFCVSALPLQIACTFFKMHAASPRFFSRYRWCYWLQLLWINKRAYGWMDFNLCIIFVHPFWDSLGVHWAHASH